MTTNVGTIDRVFRIVLGLVLLAAPFISGMALFASTPATIISVIAGIALLGTSAMKFCPMYRIFGIRTCKL
jgi:predicted benzoate:H+ symporter BenE